MRAVPPFSQARSPATVMVAATDVGLRRQRNEDAVRLAPELGLAVVADGIGGNPGGDVASALAAKQIIESIAADRELRPGAQGMSSRDRLTRAITAAQEAIVAVAITDPMLSGMGTTVVAALIADDQLCIVHVGDSRAYRLRDGQLQMLTRDHSLLEELVAGGFSRAAANHRIGRNVITRALGTAMFANADFFEDECRTGDLILLCSDGLNGMLEDRAIADLLKTKDRDLDATAAMLVEAAKEAGGYDNISVALIVIC